jgi:hypothetical protein
VRTSNPVVFTVTLANPCASVLRSSSYSSISRKSSTTLATQLPLISPHFEARYLLRASFPTRYSMLRLNQVLLTLSQLFFTNPTACSIPAGREALSHASTHMARKLSALLQNEGRFPAHGYQPQGILEGSNCGEPDIYSGPPPREH